MTALSITIHISIAKALKIFTKFPSDGSISPPNAGIARLTDNVFAVILWFSIPFISQGLFLQLTVSILWYLEEHCLLFL